jgi:hypothetical protein
MEPNTKRATELQPGDRVRYMDKVVTIRDWKRAGQAVPCRFDEVPYVTHELGSWIVYFPRTAHLEVLPDET